MENNNERVLGRTLARELTAEEIELVSGSASCTPCSCKVGGGTDYCGDVMAN